jgi:hypothetical protein
VCLCKLLTGVGLGGSPTIAPDASWPSCLLPSCCGQVLIEGSSLSDERERRTHSVRLLCLQSNGNGGQVRGTMPSVLAPGRADARTATPVRRLRRSTRQGGKEKGPRTSRPIGNWGWAPVCPWARASVHDKQLRPHSANTRVCYPTEDESRRKSAVRASLLSTRFLISGFCCSAICDPDGRTTTQRRRTRTGRELTARMTSASGPINKRSSKSCSDKNGRSRLHRAHLPPSGCTPSH